LVRDVLSKARATKAQVFEWNEYHGSSKLIGPVTVFAQSTGLASIATATAVIAYGVTRRSV
jgi:hypothetical protein